MLTVPAVEKERYYSLQFIDMYTYNFAYVGSRATGNDAGSFLLAGPGWKGETPQGIKAVIRSETEFAFVRLSHAALRSRRHREREEDPGGLQGPAAVRISWASRRLRRRPQIEFIKPLTPEQQRTSLEFFNVLNFVLQFCPTHPSETELMARFAKIGIGAGKPFDADALSPEIRQAVEDGMADAWAAFEEHKETQLDTGKLSSADIFGTRAFLKNNYMDRMSGAVLGIYGNSKDEAIYPVYFVDCGQAAAQRRTIATRCASRRTSCRRSTRSGR